MMVDGTEMAWSCTVCLSDNSPPLLTLDHTKDSQWGARLSLASVQYIPCTLFNREWARAQVSVFS